MKLKKIALGAAALALVACGEVRSSEFFESSVANW